MELSSQKIAPFLWFDDRAEEAATFYASLFEGSRVNAVTHYHDAGPGEAGSVMTVSFSLAGQHFIALNGGPDYTFTPAVSFMVSCESQEELDRLWDALCAGGGEPMQCGWLRDRFGLSWQIVPRVLGDMLTADDARSQRVMEAVFGMVKLDIAALEAAYAGTATSISGG
jgi:predicted 3-demethylubiquinone-9 3-methyltransferase (glyoxalase superfamily)